MTMGSSLLKSGHTRRIILLAVTLSIAACGGPPPAIQPTSGTVSSDAVQQPNTPISVAVTQAVPTTSQPTSTPLRKLATKVTVRPDNPVQVGDTVAVVVEVEPLEELNLTWTVSDKTMGQLNTDTGPQVRYTPTKAGKNDIVARGTTASGTPLEQKVTIEAVALPTAEPSDPPLVEIFPQAKDGEPFVFVNQPGSLQDEFSEDEACRNAGQYGLRLTYDFSGKGNGGWGVNWDKAPDHHFDASGFTEIAFYLKGNAPRGFQVGIKDVSEKEVKVEVKNYAVASQSQWRSVAIPLSKFADAKGQVNIASVRNVNFGFNQNHGSGNVCIDDISFK